jgi:beta-1,4-mannooligosaccharide/beta-1,4-mannosyl-N-acetylglucosamine phosphorylase
MKRAAMNPILTRGDIPPVSPYLADATSVFNPGAIKVGDRYLLLLRVQTRGRETVLMVAEGNNGIDFTVRPKLLQMPDLETGSRVYHVYDPRLTAIDGEIFVTFSADTDDGCFVGTARLVEGDNRLELLGMTTDRDSRNAVLFPERINGRYARLERPNLTRLKGGVMSGDRIYLAASDDLVEWELVAPVLDGRPRYWDELIGSGPPPIRVREGWLHIYHGVATHFAAANIYQAGVCLLDGQDPARILARGRNNILEPREPYELMGQVPGVVFPTGIIAEDTDVRGVAAPDSPVRVYYGAADTCVCLAETTVEQLVNACRLS